jgi:hypothetical protein
VVRRDATDVIAASTPVTLLVLLSLDPRGVFPALIAATALQAVDDRMDAARHRCPPVADAFSRRYAMQ